MCASPVFYFPVFRPSLLALDWERGRKTSDSEFAPAVRCSAPESFFVLAKALLAVPARSLFVGPGAILAASALLRRAGAAGGAQ